MQNTKKIIENLYILPPCHRVVTSNQPSRTNFPGDICAPFQMTTARIADPSCPVLFPPRNVSSLCTIFPHVPRTSELANSQQINHAARGLSNERTNKVVTPSQADEPASEEIWRLGPVAATNLLTTTTTTDVVFVKISLIFCCHVLRELECVSRPGANGIHSVECHNANAERGRIY